MSFLPPKTACFGTAIGLLLGVLAVAMPGTASAACGDYLHVRGGSGEHAMAGEGPVTEDFTGSPLEVPRQNVPCTGPHCSGVPAPLAPPVVVVPEVRDPMFLSKFAASHNDVNFLGYLFDLAVPQPVHCGTSIFHPPRSAAA